MQSELTKADQQREDNGSRDQARKFLKEAQELLCLAAQEIDKLRQSNRKDVAYRYGDADLAIAIATVEKVKIVMRKRKKAEKAIEAKIEEPPIEPIGE